MTFNISPESSKWSVAAKEGALLALVTVILTTVTTCLSENTLVNALIWLVKLAGTIWLLRFFMKKWGEAHEGESTYGFGFATSLCSAVIIAAYTFVMYKYLVPEQIVEVLEKAESILASTPGVTQDIIDQFIALEDDYAQIQSIFRLVWCTVFGSIISAILKNGTSKGTSVFTEAEMTQNNDEDDDI